MKCPYCNSDMESGYIQCRDGVFRTPKKQPIAALSFFAKNSVSMQNGAADNANTVFAHKCGICMKVIIDYSAAESDREQENGFAVTRRPFSNSPSPSTRSGRRRDI